MNACQRALLFVSVTFFLSNVIITTAEELVAAKGTECNKIIVKSVSWSSGYNGVFRIRKTDAVHARRLRLTFDKSFVMFNLYAGTIIAKNQNTYLIMLQSWGLAQKGNMIKMGLTAQYTKGQEPKLLKATLESAKIKCLCGCSKDLISTPTNKITTTVAAPTSTEQTDPTPGGETTDNIISTTVDATTSTKQPDLASGGTTTDNLLKCTPTYNYTEVLFKSLLFYEAQRSGKLPSNQRVPWRRDSALNDGSDVHKDLVGGYYDGGDFVKFGFPMASAITNLAWGMIEFKKGYVESNQYKYGLEALKWGTDYFIKCHTSKNEFYGQVSDGETDHSSWGRPENMTGSRISRKIDVLHPGSDLAAETAAALAATSIVFNDDGDHKYAETLLNHAKQLYEFADNFRGKYSDSIPDAAKFYNSYNGYQDELAWASLWLYKASGIIKYKEIFLSHYDNEAFSRPLQEFSWNDKWAGVCVLAAKLKITEKDYLKNLKLFMSSCRKTPKGLIFVSQWGSNRHAANIAFLSLIAYEVTNDEYYETFGRKQIHYMLGDSGRSYVVGFGNNPPQRPRHRSSSCPSTGPCNWAQFSSANPNPHILFGALVGGPDADDSYVDDRKDYVKNEVTIDFNAGFQSAIAGLLQLSTIGKC